MRNKYFLLAAALLAFASCDKNETTSSIDPTDPAKRVAVQFTGSTLDIEPAPETRAVSPWKQTGKIGIYAFYQTSDEIADDYANVPYACDGSGNTFTPVDKTIYFPVNGSRLRFMAYFPHQNLTGPIYKTGTTYKVDLTTQPNPDGQAAVELLWTGGITASANKMQPNVSLNFKRQYARIMLTVKNGNGITADDLKKMTVSITDMHRKADFNLMTGRLTPTDNAASLTLKDYTADGTGRTALVLPTTADAGRTMDFTLGTDTFRWPIGGKAFEAGKSYTYTVTVNRTPLGLTATVTEWEEGAGDNGIAE
ncbi:fimbrillin family protein [Parabacteroides massiliensis]|uniref:fimbrillin family protein n=1 Tax=Parabacteroides massiliensis TaxID=1750560 RepID=UPI00096AA742|nr:fimbrillin family protein [Parabacteroides massiliensis]